MASPPAPQTAVAAPLKTPSLLSQVVETPYTPWTTSALLLGAVPFCVKNAAGFPHLVQLPLFSLIFGVGGYMTQSGDALNGSGTTTAWSLTYLFLHGKKALISKRPVPIALASVVAAQAATFGYYYSNGESQD
ncbi:hypothetical protein BCR35DRAFT_349785 [Leucosporidium creatinivorum]|uniref:Uncharacterized protein n=1 Tax=Leucosporidium creatinivorum TaxID=106004 RepID=A0A1Y2G3H8_9BASI|nr:hypothetical protein BCR35DRAFT_349785 [Leucosporidium creatinivorum]